MLMNTQGKSTLSTTPLKLFPATLFYPIYILFGKYGCSNCLLENDFLSIDFNCHWLFPLSRLTFLLFFNVQMPSCTKFLISISVLTFEILYPFALLRSMILLHLLMSCFALKCVYVLHDFRNPLNSTWLCHTTTDK